MGFDRGDDVQPLQCSFCVTSLTGQNWRVDSCLEMDFARKGGFIWRQLSPAVHSPPKGRAAVGVGGWFWLSSQICGGWCWRDGWTFASFRFFRLVETTPGCQAQGCIVPADLSQAEKESVRLGQRVIGAEK